MESIFKKILCIVIMVVCVPVMSVCAQALPPLPETGKRHYVIYREGSRGNRIEISAFNIYNEHEDRNYVFWDGELQIFFNYNYRDDEKWFLNGETWEKFAENHWCISNNATEVLGSDLKVIDCRSGIDTGLIEIIKKEESIAPFARYWDGNYYVSFKETDEGIVLICSDDGINEITSVTMPEELISPQNVVSAGDNILIIQQEENVELDIYGKRQGDYGNSPIIILDRNYKVAEIKEITGLTEFLYKDGEDIYLRNTDYSSIIRTDSGYEGQKSIKYFKTCDGLNWNEISQADIKSSNEYNHNNFKKYNITEKGKGLGVIPHENLNVEYEILLESNDNLNDITPVKTGKFNIYSVSNIMGRVSYEENGKIYSGARTRVRLTLDGIYHVELPIIKDYSAYYNWNKKFMWCTGEYVYVDINDDVYYKISLDLWDNPMVVYNGKVLGFKNSIITENNRTLVPMRFLFEQMGAEVSWDETTNTATVSKASDVVSFSIDNTVATVNAQPKTMDVPARLINDKTYIPLRFLSEELGYTVEWDEEANTVIITE